MHTTPDPAEPREVSPLELFYDLVFVFAISQLSTHLLHDPTWRGAAETLVLLCAVFTVWVQTTFEATYLDITRRDTQIGLLAAMALGLFMNAAISGAFDDAGFVFATVLVVTQIARGIVTSIKAPTAPLRQHYRRALTWILASAPVWLTGAAVDPGPRLWVWAIAAAIDVTGIWLAHPWPHSRMNSHEIVIDQAHMTERLRLFLIIALGSPTVRMSADAVMGSRLLKRPADREARVARRRPAIERLHPCDSRTHSWCHAPPASASSCERRRGTAQGPGGLVGGGQAAAV